MDHSAKRQRRRAGSHKEHNDDELFYDDEDRERLDAMDDYTREKELALRYDSLARQRQREELLAHDKKAVVETTVETTVEPPADAPADAPAASQSPTVHLSSIFEDGVGAAARGKQDSCTLPRSDKKLDKALASLTVAGLEGARLTASFIRDMREHPQVATYIQGCLVRSREKNGSDKICRITIVEPASRGSTDPFDMIVVPIGSSTSFKLPLSLVDDEPFSERDLSSVRTLLRSDMTDLAMSMHHSIQQKATQLRQFTFTEDDVAEILERKRQQQTSHGAPGHAYRTSYQRKTDVAAEVDSVKLRLQVAGLTQIERREKTNQLRKLELELHDLNRQTTTQARSLVPIAATTPRRQAGSALLISGGRAYKPPSGLLMSSSSAFDRHHSEEVTTQPSTQQQGPAALMRIMAAAPSVGKAAVNVTRQLAVLRAVLDIHSSDWDSELSIDITPHPPIQSIQYPPLVHPPLINEALLSVSSCCQFDPSTQKCAPENRIPFSPAIK